MHIVIQNTSPLPIYEQITQQMKAQIFTGTIAEGEMLPSIRQLAKDLKISVITTTRAYNELEHEGFLATVPGKGCFVLPQNKQLLRESALRKIEEQLLQTICEAQRADICLPELMEILHTLAEEEHYE